MEELTQFNVHLSWSADDGEGGGPISRSKGECTRMTNNRPSGNCPVQDQEALKEADAATAALRSARDKFNIGQATKEDVNAAIAIVEAAPNPDDLLAVAPQAVKDWFAGLIVKYKASESIS